MKYVSRAQTKNSTTATVFHMGFARPLICPQSVRIWKCTLHLRISISTVWFRQEVAFRNKTNSNTTKVSTGSTAKMTGSAIYAGHGQESRYPEKRNSLWYCIQEAPSYLLMRHADASRIKQSYSSTFLPNLYQMQNFPKAPKLDILSNWKKCWQLFIGIHNRP